MSVYSGDFLGFQLGNWHSSRLNITRVSNSDRYTEQLTPQINNITTAIPGGNGTYYWDTLFTQRPFTIDFAFDDLRDEDIRNLKIECNTKGVKDLIFDETPYKKYRVVVAAPPTLKYIAFQQDEVIVYKGEGSINLIAYYPYAIGTHTIVNKNKLETSTEILICNNGDMPTPLNVLFKSTSANTAHNIEFKLKYEEEEDYYTSFILDFGAAGWNPSNENQQYFYYINSNNHLIEEYGWKPVNTINIYGKLDAPNATIDSLNQVKTNQIYNKAITTGDFLILQPGRNYLTFPQLGGTTYTFFTEQYY